MPTSPEAIERFLNYQAPSATRVRGRSPDELREMILQATGLPWSPKVEWRGDDRDLRQLEGITHAILQRRSLLYYAPRVGKTRISLDWMQHLVRVGEVQKSLIVAHSPLGVDEWERQVPIFSDLKVQAVRSGPGSQEQFLSAMEGENDGLLCTWSTLQQIFSEKRLNRKKQSRLYADLDSLRLLTGVFQSVVVDEVHGVNDPGSLRFEIIAAIAGEDVELTPWRLCLTGTPFGRNAFGLWSQARIADGGATLSKSYYFFMEAFGKRVYNHFSKTKDELVFDAKKMPILRAKLDHMVLSCRLEEIQDVNIISQSVELKMLREQDRAYQELIQEMIEDARTLSEEGVTARTRNIFVRLRQVASGYRVFDDDEGNERVIDFPSAKLQWLEEFLTDLDPSLKVVIFHEFVRSGQRICDTLTRLKIKHHWLWGGSPDKRTAKDEFQYGSVPILVANHATGGTGVDLSAAHYLCCYESPVGVIARQQMMARPMARGGTPLVVDDLVCSPVERKILSFQSEGRAISEMFHQPKKLAGMLK